MKTKQSILEDYDEIQHITMKDIAKPSQKYIHFWDFMDLDFKVHEFQARLGMAIIDLKKDMQERYKGYYTNAIIQTPEKFVRHNKELLEIEYFLENPFFLALIHFALTKEVDDMKLHHKALSFKKRLMEKRMDLKKTLEDDLLVSNKLLIK
jgi:hypothetical protein